MKKLFTMLIACCSVAIADPTLDSVATNNKNLFRIFLKLMLQKLRSPYVSLYSSIARNFSTAYDTFLTN
jgi:5-methylcytosine-specific restriction endonuclease McrBC regulatory subunit McrC